MLDPQGSVGLSEKTILLDSLAIMLAIVLPTITATVVVSWWFRESNARAKYRPDWTFSGGIEMVSWGVPVLTIMLLGGVTWIGSHELDPAKPLESPVKPIEIQVISLDWKWLFIYPEQHVASVNRLVVPINTPLHLSLTSGSVMNAFFVPQLGSMIYTMNGMTTQLNLMAAASGTYRGLSSHYSGDGFSDMYFDVHALPSGEFASWVASTQGSGKALDEATYQALARQSKNVSPFIYGELDPAIFGRIASQQIPPAEGPTSGAPTVDVSNRSEQ